MLIYVAHYTKYTWIWIVIMHIHVIDMISILKLAFTDITFK